MRDKAQHDKETYECDVTRTREAARRTSGPRGSWGHQRPDGNSPHDGYPHAKRTDDSQVGGGDKERSTVCGRGGGWTCGTSAATETAFGRARTAAGNKKMASQCQVQCTTCR